MKKSLVCLSIIGLLAIVPVHADKTVEANDRMKAEQTQVAEIMKTDEGCKMMCEEMMKTPKGKKMMRETVMNDPESMKMMREQMKSN